MYAVKGVDALQFGSFAPTFASMARTEADRLWERFPYSRKDPAPFFTLLPPFSNPPLLDTPQELNEDGLLVMKSSGWAKFSVSCLGAA